MPWPCGQQHRTVGSLTTPLSCSPFAFSGEPRGAACPAPLGDPPGHPATRPFGFAALLGLAGAGRTRLYEPQTGCRPFSCQPCATRPRKRDELRCALHHLCLSDGAHAPRGYRTARPLCGRLFKSAAALCGCAASIPVLLRRAYFLTTDLQSDNGFCFKCYVITIIVCPAVCQPRRCQYQIEREQPCFQARRH